VIESQHTDKCKAVLKIIFTNL